VRRAALPAVPALVVCLSVFGAWSSAPPVVESPDDPFVVVSLSDGGQVVIELFPSEVPETVANFRQLVGDRYYDGLVFHRAEDWVVQTGSINGDGTGGPPWCIDLESSKHPNTRGAVGMAREFGKPNSAGSQFYVLRKDALQLDDAAARSDDAYTYCVFGRVVQGMNVVDSMKVGAEIASAREVPYSQLPAGSAGAAQ